MRIRTALLINVTCLSLILTLPVPAPGQVKKQGVELVGRLSYGRPGALFVQDGYAYVTETHFIDPFHRRETESSLQVNAQDS